MESVSGWKILQSSLLVLGSMEVLCALSPSDAYTVPVSDASCTIQLLQNPADYTSECFVKFLSDPLNNFQIQITNYDDTVSFGRSVALTFAFIKGLSCSGSKICTFIKFQMMTPSPTNVLTLTLAMELSPLTLVFRPTPMERSS